MFGSSLPRDTIDEGKDSNLWQFLRGENMQSDIELIDMGQIEEEERPFMIVDKDTGNVYDSRNMTHVNRLTNHVTMRSSNLNVDPEIRNKSESSKSSAWGNWWKQKRKNNEEML